MRLAPAAQSGRPFAGQGRVKVTADKGRSAPTGPAAPPSAAAAPSPGPPGFPRRQKPHCGESRVAARSEAKPPVPPPLPGVGRPHPAAGACEYCERYYGEGLRLGRSPGLKEQRG